MSKEERVKSVMLVPTPICTACFDFTVDELQRERRTVVIAPIVIEEKMSGVFQISWACSRSVDCRDRYCRYNHSFKRRRNQEDEPVEPLASLGGG